jgi:hypothetical protein
MAETWSYAMTIFAVLGVLFLALFLAPLFGQDRPVARY